MDTRELFTDAILPFTGVAGVVLVSTAVLFDVPAAPPPRPAHLPAMAPSVARAGVSGAPGPQAPSPGRTRAPDRPARETASDVMARAVLTLSAAASPSSGGQPGPAASAAGPGAEDPETMSALSAISESVRAAREVRTEADLIRAEEGLREARRRMQTACARTGGPLCQSAAELERLGF